MSSHPQVLVVGGGPAGLATAIACRQNGLSVQVVDRFQPPLDKACGEGLMPDGLEALHSLGVFPEPAGRPFRGIRYLDGDKKVEAWFPGPPGLGVRRPTLHGLLESRAKEIGVAFRWGVAVTGLTPTGVTTDGGILNGRWIVGADGLHSRVRSWAGLSRGAGRRRRFGVRRHYRMPPWTDCVEVYWGPGAEAYVTPVAADQVGVALLWGGASRSFDKLLERFPVLRQKLHGAEPLSRDRGAGPLHQRVKGLSAGPVVLVGDAAGYLDALTGEGLSLAFRQAISLGAALAVGDLSRYQTDYRRLAVWPRRFTRLALAMERRPRLRRFSLQLLAARPSLFTYMLATVTKQEIPAGSQGRSAMNHGLRP